MQDLLLYQTEAINTSILDYEDQANIFRGSDVSYATNGVLHGDDQEFEFPLLRETDGGINIQEQCEGMLRSKIWTSKTRAWGSLLTLDSMTALFGNSASGLSWESMGSDRPMMGREIRNPQLSTSLLQKTVFTEREWSLFGIQDLQMDDYIKSEGAYYRPIYRKEQISWNPLDRSGLSGVHNFTRTHVVQSLTDWQWEDRIWDGLYDARLIPSKSLFCDNRSNENDFPIRQDIELNIKDTFLHIIGNDPLNFDFKDFNLLKWDAGARSVGAMEFSCPCPFPEQDSGQDMCSISRFVCEIPVLPGEIRDICDTLDIQIEEQFFTYRKTIAPLVRDALYNYGEKYSDKVLIHCSTFQPSSLWGIEINDKSTGEINDKMTESLLWHGASGIFISNLKHVNETIPLVISESERKIRIRSEDGSSGIGVPHCSTRNSSLIEETAFPAAHVVPESPVVLACARYILEGVLEKTLQAHGVSGAPLNAIIKARAKWRSRCETKINKLRSCQELGAFGKYGHRENLEICPFSISQHMKAFYRLLPNACLVLDISDNGNSDLYDPFACLQRPSGYSLMQVVESKLDDKCKIRNPLRVLTGDSMGLEDLPGLGLGFVDEVLGREYTHEDDIRAEGVHDYIFPEKGINFRVWFNSGSLPIPGSDVGDRCHRLRERLLSLNSAPTAGSTVYFTDEEWIAFHCDIGPDRAFVIADGMYWKPGALLADVNEEKAGAYYKSVPYWPQEWQYPLGEAVTEHVEFAPGFANYMALVDGEVRVLDGLERALYEHNASMQFYGTTGKCREHTVGMPLKDINTHRLCTSESDSENGDFSAACSQSSAVDVGGGIGSILGPFFQVAQLWLSTNGFEESLTYDYDYFLKFNEASDHASEAGVGDPSSLQILRTQCKNDPRKIERALDMIDPEDHIECSRTMDCNNSKGHVCYADGRCGPLQIVVENGMQSHIEFGVVSPGCSDSIDAGGSSPWKRAPHFLAQHGMCSHRFSITYERMLLALAAENNTMQACTLRNASDSDALGLWWVSKKDLPYGAIDLTETVGGEILRRRLQENHVFSLAAWKSLGIENLSTNSYVTLNDGRTMMPVGDRKFEYFECRRNLTEWDWVGEAPDWWAELSKAKDEDTAETVGDLGEFEMHPHPCDYELMHATDWGWCPVRHADTENSAYSYWTRLAASSDNFTIMRDTENPKDDISKDFMAWNKMRFLGLDRSALERTLNNDNEQSSARVTRCANFGICENGDFTFGGVRGQFHRYFKNADTEKVQFYGVDNVDKCGPMGVYDKGETCYLDAGVNALFSASMRQTEHGCRALLGIHETPETSSLLQFDEPRKVWTYKIQQVSMVRTYINRFFTLSMDGKHIKPNVDYHSTLIECGKQIIEESKNATSIFIEKQKYTVYANKSAGVYIFLDYVALEVPVFWWIKYATERILHIDASYHVAKSPPQRWYDVELLESVGMEVPITSYKNRGTIVSRSTVAEIWSSVNTVSFFPMPSVENVFLNTIARWLHGQIGDRLIFGRPRDMHLIERDKVSQNIPKFRRCFEHVVYDADVDVTEDGVIQKVCLEDNDFEIMESEIKLATQFAKPLLSTGTTHGFSSGNAMFSHGSTESNDFLKIDALDGSLHFLEILIRKIYEKMTVVEREKVLGAFDPYAPQNTIIPSLSVESHEEENVLPLFQFGLPVNDAWKNNLETNVAESVVQFLEEIDEREGIEFPDIQESDATSNKNCLFNADDIASMENRAFKQYNIYAKVEWPDAEYKYDSDSKQINFNICDESSGNLNPVYTSTEYNARGPSCTFGGANLDADTEYQRFKASEFDETIFISRNQPSEFSLWKSKTQQCRPEDQCCPDDLVLRAMGPFSLTKTSLTPEREVYFGSIYKNSHKYYEEKTKSTKSRCIRTQSTCFKGKNANTAWRNIQTDWKDRKTCTKNFSIKIPKKEFNVRLFKMHEGMSMREVMFSDRITVDSDVSPHGRFFSILKHASGNPIFPSPASSSCPDSGQHYAMHKFRKMDLSNAKDHYAKYEGQTYDMPSSMPFQRIRQSQESLRKVKLSAYDIIKDKNIMLRYFKERWLGFDYQTGTLSNSVARQFSFKKEDGNSRSWVPSKWVDIVDDRYEYKGKHSDEHPVAIYNQTTDYEKYNTALNTFKDNGMLCNPRDTGDLGLKWKSTGSGIPYRGVLFDNEKLAEALQTKVEFQREELDELLKGGPPLISKSYVKRGDHIFVPEIMEWGPNTNKMSIFEFGMCYNDDIIENIVETVTACEYLSHIFSGKYVDYFMHEFMDIDPRIKEARITELFEPIANNDILHEEPINYDSRNEPFNYISRKIYRKMSSERFKIDLEDSDFDLSEAARDNWNDFCSHEYPDRDTLICNNLHDLKSLNSRHMFASFNFGENYFTDKSENGTDRLSPCLPGSTAPEVYDPDGRLYGFCGTTDSNSISKPDILPKDNCWDKCNNVEGECEHVCGSYWGCCRGNYGSGSVQESLIQYAQGHDTPSTMCLNTDNEGIENYHFCARLTTGSYPESPKVYQGTCIPAAKTAMDVIDTRGWCKGGGSVSRVDRLPSQWLQIDKILRNKAPDSLSGSGNVIWVPCDPKCDIEENKNAAECLDCESVFQEATDSDSDIGKEETTRTKTYNTKGDASVCSFDLSLDEEYTCGKTLHGAREACDQFREHDVYTEYNTENSRRSVAWRCEPCFKYDVGKKRKFSANTKKVGFGFFYGESTKELVSKDSDGLQALTETIENMFNTEANSDDLAVFLENSINENNEINEDVHAKMHYVAKNDSQAIIVYQKLDELQAPKFALPDDILSAFRDFGSVEYIEPPESEDIESWGCSIIHHEQLDSTPCDLLMRNGLETYEAHEKSELFRAALLGGCRAEEDSPTINTRKCSPHITEADNRYARLNLFQERVLSKKFGLPLPQITANTKNIMINVTDIDWVRGMVPFYAKAERSKERVDDVYIDHIFNHEKRCEEMYNKDRSFRNLRISKQDLPCFEDWNETVGILNPWLGGNYSFPGQVKTFFDIIGLDDEDPKQKPRVVAGFDTCQRGQTISGSNQQPCQATTCIADQNPDEIAPNDINRTVCRFSAFLNSDYRNHELFLKLKEEMAQDFGDNLATIYTAPTVHSPCDKMYSPNKLCTHKQAFLGFAPSDRHRMRPAPSLKRTDNYLNSKIKLGIFGFGSSENSTLSESIWARRRASNKMLGPGAEYMALAVDPYEISPARVKLHAEKFVGNFLVSEVSWRQGPSWPSEPDWVRMSSTDDFIQDGRVVDENPLYNTHTPEKHHWSCPLLFREVVTNSPHVYHNHKETRLLMPDPVRSLKLFPKLGGRHPAFRTTRVAPEHLERYHMVGLRELRHNSGLKDDIDANGLREIMRDFLEAQRSFVRVTGKKPAKIDQCLRWPRMHSGALRSGENIDGISTCPPGSITDMGHSFENRTQVWVDANANINTSMRQATANTGVCYRAPLVTMSKEEWNEITDAVKFLKCRRISPTLSGKTRTVRCWRGGNQSHVDYVFGTNTAETTSPSRFRDTLSRAQVAPAPTPTVGENSEISIATRHKISPLRARLRRAGLSHLEPEAAWVRGVSLFSRALVAPENRTSVYFDSPWGGRNCNGERWLNMSYNEWASPDTRGQRCIEMLSDNTLSCSTQGVDLDLCEFEEIRPLCEYMSQLTRDMGRLNTINAGFFYGTGHYYTPTNYHHDDAEFVSRAVVQTYKSMGITGCPAWFDISKEQTIVDDDSLCAENIIRFLIEQLSYFRQILMDIVEMFFLIAEFFGNAILALVLQIASLAVPDVEILSSMANKAIQDLLNGFLTIIEVGIEFLGRILERMFRVFLNTFAPWIEDAIHMICEIIGFMIDNTIAVLSFISDVISFIFSDAGSEISRLISSVSSWKDEILQECLALDLDGSDDENTGGGIVTRIYGDFCIPEYFSANGGLATHFFYGMSKSATCADSSMCLREGFAVMQGESESEMPSIVCARCPGGLYGCNAMISAGTCTCGIQTDAVMATQCSITQDCEQPGSSCMLSDRGYTTGDITSAIACTIGLQQGRRPTCVYSGQVGLCLLLPGNVVSQITRGDELEVNNFIAVIMPYQKTTQVTFSEIALSPSTMQFSFAGQELMQLDNCGEGSPCPIVGVDITPSRRLLSWLSSPTKYPYGKTDKTDTHENAPNALRRDDYDTDGTESSTPLQRHLLQDNRDPLIPNVSSWWFFDVDITPPEFQINEMESNVPCVRSGYIAFDAFILRSVLKLAGPGWRAKRECTNSDAQDFLGISMNCPVGSVFVEKLVDNLQILVRYYRNNSCFSNLATSCVQSKSQRTTNSDLWPVFPKYNFEEADLRLWKVIPNDENEKNITNLVLLQSTELLNNLVKIQLENSDQTTIELTNYSMYRTVRMKHYLKSETHTFLPDHAISPNTTDPENNTISSFPVLLSKYTVGAFVSIFQLPTSYYKGVFFNSISLEAVSNDDEYRYLRENHEYTIGRIIRDTFRCNFEDSIQCEKQNNGLLLSFTTMFVFILLIVTFFPLPSVIKFFVWTLGLTLGVMYLAYGYSPFCAPRVPNCLGSGLENLVSTFLPQKMTIPQPLLNSEYCDADGFQKKKGRYCFRQCSELANPVNDALDVPIALEMIFSRAPGFTFEWQKLDNDTPYAKEVPVSVEILAALDKCAKLRMLLPKYERWRPCKLEISHEERNMYFSNVTAKNVYKIGEHVWRPRGGLFITERIIDSIRSILQSLIDLDSWRFLDEKVENAVQNNLDFEGNGELLPAVLICVFLYSFQFLAWVLLIIALVPVVIYTVQYVIIVNVIFLNLAINRFFNYRVGL